MDISISFEPGVPISGTLRTGSGGPIEFVGWLALLRLLSDLSDQTEVRVP
jgi:hypothetical protein